MFELYNTHSEIARNLSFYFKNVCSSLSKPQLKIIPPILLGMIEAESAVTSDFVKKFKDDFSNVAFNSIIRRIERFSNNPKFDIYSFFHSIICDVISKLKLKNKKVYIALDHSYCKDSFTILMFSLRLGKQRYSSLVSMF